MKHRSPEWKRWYEDRSAKLSTRYRFSMESSIHGRPSLRDVGKISGYYILGLVALVGVGFFVLIGVSIGFVALNLLFSYLVSAGWIIAENRAEVLIFLLQLLWGILVVFLVRERRGRKENRIIAERGI